VIQINKLAMFTTDEAAINEVYNVAFGESSTLNQLFGEIKNNLTSFDSQIGSINCIYGEFRKGDIPHSLASIEKAKKRLNYSPTHSLKEGLKETVQWYWMNKKI
jgi:UDP-N-acetylglucosamine 4-epimerase